MITVNTENTPFKHGDILQRTKDGALVIVTKVINHNDDTFEGTLFYKNGDSTRAYHYQKWEIKEFSYFRGKATIHQ